MPSSAASVLRPVREPRLLGGGVDPREAVARRRGAGLIAAPQQLPLPPVPLVGVQRTQPRVGGGAAGLCRVGRESQQSAEDERGQQAANARGSRHDKPRFAAPSRVGRAAPGRDYHMSTPNRPISGAIASTARPVRRLSSPLAERQEGVGGWPGSTPVQAGWRWTGGSFSSSTACARTRFASRAAVGIVGAGALVVSGVVVLLR